MTTESLDLADTATTAEPVRTRAKPRLIAGVDEAGRGPLAGPVSVAAVILNPRRRIDGLDDSKKLSEARREALYPLILERALAWRIEFVEVEEIDRINIFQATMTGMRRAVIGLAPVADLVRVDGNHLPQGLPCRGEALIGGDATEPAIMAASILAKVARDRMMRSLHQRYPQYGFDQHKGYSTAAHLAALSAHGPCPHHRRSFAPVRTAYKNLSLF
ncbi:ribonuclease HII family protein [Lysobacter antibioticus]|uniref:Ribonuclease HII n=1 Tax=Lysobacter antibioticus TaxID=84531 RepID=A0A0S2F988_LYSAN|nr:ribonuclease HII [Lysobacter antibioticus]ALN80052.1 ribonuclease HII family protein [Lysobacter antibioticus]